ncbi:MAG: DUF2782 domain-containing protein [Gammaproteobacteria bacterium]|nr:DUF2782 domain-containing protein [Gammaproteobacteria bacterium]
MLLLVATVARGQDMQADDFPEAPPPPVPVQRVLPPPVITQLRRDHETVAEYRINGHYYMAFVQPDNGPPFYLVDSDGDGHLDFQASPDYDAAHVPGWLQLLNN